MAKGSRGVTNGIRKKVMTIGITLHSKDDKKEVEWIHQKLREEPSLAHPLRLLIENGLVHDLLKANLPACLPDSATHLDKISNRLKEACIREVTGDALSAIILKKLKEKDKSIVDTLFYFMLAETPASPVPPSLKTEEDFKNEVAFRAEVVGKRLVHLKYGADYVVDCKECGCFYVEASEEEGGISKVTHRFSKQSVDLPPGILGGQTYTIEQNNSELDNILKIGKYTSIHLRDHFKEADKEAVFNYDAKRVEYKKAQAMKDAEDAEEERLQQLQELRSAPKRGAGGASKNDSGPSAAAGGGILKGRGQGFAGRVRITPAAGRRGIT